jgi:hypothetical protein
MRTLRSAKQTHDETDKVPRDVENIASDGECRLDKKSSSKVKLKISRSFNDESIKASSDESSSDISDSDSDSQSGSDNESGSDIESSGTESGSDVASGSDSEEE